MLPELLEELTRYSLIRLETEYRYSIHRLVQEVLRDRLTPERRQQWLDRAVSTLNETFPYPEFENWWWCDRLVEQVQAVVGQPVTQSIDLAWLLNATGHFLCEQGQYMESEPLLVQALEVIRSQLGLEHLDTASSLNNLALLYKSQGCYEESEPLLVQALEIIRSQLGQSIPTPPAV